MSIYNILYGKNCKLVVCTSFALGFNIEEVFPRFRDCFTKDKECPVKDYDVLIYTRMGGGNRACWEDKEPDCECPACRARALEKKPFVVGRYDDSYDCTYSFFVIKFNKKQKAIFDKFYSCEKGDEFFRMGET